MHRSHRLIAALALLLLVAGGLVMWLAVRPDGAASQQLSMAELMSKAGCGDRKVERTVLFARETGSCGLNGEYLFFEVFASTELRDRYLEFGAQFGGPPDVVGDYWIVSVDSASTRELLKQRLGGTIR